MYCYNCGKEIAGGDKFCQSCGAEVVKPKRFNAKPKSDRSAEVKPKQEQNPSANPPVKNVEAAVSKEAKSAEKSVRYVYVDKKTGKRTKNPSAKSSTESVMQWMTISFIALAVVIVMVAGSMFISGQMVKSVFSGNVQPNLTDENITSADVSSETVSSDNTSSEVSSVPTDLLAENIQSKIKGTWSTNIPYKSMSIPATFVFDGKGTCSCSLKALFISKKFEGSYSVNDGGACSITLVGLEEYVGGSNTMSGNVEFPSEDQMTFTVDSTVWQLSRTE